MSNQNPTIYGLEHQCRALVPQLAENNDIRFFIATQSLQTKNQIHLVEFNDENSTLAVKIFAHPLGEIWKLNSCPYDPRMLLSCFSSQKGMQVLKQTAILKLPEELNLEGDNIQDFYDFENTELLSTESFGNEVQTTEFHPTDQNTLCSIIDGKIVLWDRTESKTRVVAEINIKNSPKFTAGKWSQHHQGNQFVALHDCGIRSYDIRTINSLAWSIDNAHNQLVRDLDCNPNKQCHIVTGGDDGCLKIWDTRMPNKAVFARHDHSHWVWSVRFNTFHDQLILSSSSDCKVLLTCAASVSSENGDDGETKMKLEDGLLQTYDQHEDSVYSVEWSSVDPWVFASLSYDGRVIVSKIPKHYKYQILF